MIGRDPSQSGSSRQSRNPELNGLLHIDPASLGLDVSRLPEEYRNAFDAIPTLSFRDNRSGLQKLGDHLGITNYLDTLQADAEHQAKLDYQQLVNMAREEEYNSELAKVRRNAQAGINSDLQGTGNVSEAAEYNEAAESYRYPSSGFQEVGSFMSSIPDVVSKALAMYSAFQGIKSQGIDLVNKQLGSLSINYDSLSSFLLKSLSREDFDNIIDGHGLSVAFQDKTLNALGLTSRSARRQANKMFQLVNNSFERELKAYKSYEDFDKSRRHFNEVRSEPFFSESNSDFQAGLKPLKSYIFEAMKAEQEYKKALFDREKKYNFSRSGSAQAFAENARDRYESGYYGALDSSQIARSANADARFNIAYKNSLDGSQIAGFDYDVKKYESKMASLKKNMVEQLMKNDDPFSSFLAFQLISGVNPTQSVKDVVDIVK